MNDGESVYMYNGTWMRLMKDSEKWNVRTRQQVKYVPASINKATY